MPLDRVPGKHFVPLVGCLDRRRPFFWSYLSPFVWAPGSLGIAKASRCVLPPVLVLILLVFSGCASLSEQISSLLSENKYAEARKKLDEAQVGEVVALAARKNQDRLLARQLFQDRLEKDFADEKQRLLTEGKARHAAERADEAVRLCPWSEVLKRSRADSHALVAQIDALGEELRRTLDTRSTLSPDLPTQRSVLKKAAAYRSLLADSPSVENNIRRLESNMLALWNERLAEPAKASDRDRAEFHADLELIGVPTESQREILSILAQAKPLADIHAHPLRRESVRRDVLDALRAWVRPGPAVLERIRTMLRARLITYLSPALREELQRADVTYLMIGFAEEVLALLPSQQAEFRSLVGRGHLERARGLAPTARTAVLSLIHLDRARALSPSLDASHMARIQATAEASFAAAGRLQLRLQMDMNPEPDPILQDLVQLAVFRTIVGRSKQHVQWRLFTPGDSPAAARVSIDSIRLLLPGLDQLRSVTSSYLSHYENVPNPYKGALEAQLATQRIAVNFAESSLRSAISSHNIYPTEWSLTNVNSARTRYNIAVDYYNMLVRQYNLTPSTITRPVYLPYSFYEGTIRQGWILSGSIIVADRRESFTLEDTDTDFVRIGSRTDDNESQYRREDPIDIPIGVDRLLSQLSNLANSVADKLGRMMQQMNVQTRVELSSDERAILVAAIHPFGSDRVDPQSSPIPAWSHATLRRFELPQLLEPRAPTVRLSPPRTRFKGGDPEYIFRSHSPAVAMIFSKGLSPSTGSGALISGDGLILTAAHVLRADKLEVEFPGSGDNRRYPAEIVFANDSSDVALIRAAGHRSSFWLEVALEEGPRAGEPVVAIGNPTLPREGVAKTSVSSGIVARPYDPTTSEGLQSLVADITVASGSSGSPLISQRTGKIIGVVSSVVTPTVSKDFATSGYWVLAVPSTELPKWLGLTYGPQ